MDQEEPQKPINRPVFNFPDSFKKRLWWYLVLIVVAFDWMAWLEVKAGQYNNYPEYAIFAFSGLIYVLLVYSYLTKKEAPMALNSTVVYLLVLSFMAMTCITIISWLVRSGLV